LFNKPLGEVLLTPTRIYAKSVMALMKDFDILGMAHITGGGITGNTPRMLPKGTQALIRKGTWDTPPIFTLVRKKAGVDDNEMFRDFNMGIGMVLAVPAKQADAVMKKARKLGEQAYLIGEIVKGKPGVKYEER
jgi:phosphoribosylformylglycinamidine cyclo-ligase